MIFFKENYKWLMKKCSKQRGGVDQYYWLSRCYDGWHECLAMENETKKIDGKNKMIGEDESFDNMDCYDYRMSIIPAPRTTISTTTIGTTTIGTTTISTTIGTTIGPTIGTTIGTTIGPTIGTTIGTTIGPTIRTTIGTTIGTSISNLVASSTGTLSVLHCNVFECNSAVTLSEFHNFVVITAVYLTLIFGVTRFGVKLRML